MTDVRGGAREAAAPDRTAPREKVLGFLGTSSCKLVFRRWQPKGVGTPETGRRKKRSSPLCLLDYAEKEPSVRELAGVRAFAPLISLDGRRIVYNTSFKLTDIFVRRLDSDAEPVRVAFGANPHWWIDPRSSDEYVIYRTACEKSKWPHPGETMKQRLDPVTDRPIGEPVRLFDQGFGGGLSPDGRWLSTGYHTLDVVDLRSCEHYRPLGEEQVCCVSTPPDGSGRVMQLRLPHDRFGIIRHDGAGETDYSCPEGTVEWQTPEWSNHPDYAAAVAANERESYDVYLIRLSDGEALKVVGGGCYVHPCLWCAV